MNGGFVSNDYGYLDDEGFLYILGRKEEILSESPRRVFAAECEEALYRLDAVRRCAALAEEAGRRLRLPSPRRRQGGAREGREGGDRLRDRRRGRDPVNGLGKIDRRTLARARARSLVHGSLAGARSDADSPLELRRASARSISDTVYDNGLATLKATRGEGSRGEVIDWATDDFYSSLSPAAIARPLRIMYALLMRTNNPFRRPYWVSPR